MPRYLGPEWLAAVREAAGQSPAGTSTTGVELVVSLVVTGGPDGDVSYHVRVGPEGTAVGAGDAAGATVRISTDYGTASAIAAGEQSAQAAFMSGRLRVGGDLEVLVASASALEAVADVFAAVRPHRRR